MPPHRHDFEEMFTLLEGELGVQSRSVVESAMLMLHSGRPYGTDSSRQRQDHARRPSCYTSYAGDWVTRSIRRRGEPAL